MTDYANRFLMCRNSRLLTRRNYFGYFSFIVLSTNKSLFSQQKTYVSVPAMGPSQRRGHCRRKILPSLCLSLSGVLPEQNLTHILFFFHSSQFSSTVHYRGFLLLLFVCFCRALIKCDWKILSPVVAQRHNQQIDKAWPDYFFQSSFYFILCYF